MKKISFLLTALFLAGCAKNNSFHPEIRGIAFWESPQTIYDAFQQGSFDHINECFSIFMVKAATSNWDGYQFERKLGMGIPQNMAQRVTEKHTSLLRKEDITSVEWINVDSDHATGSFEFDAFYGSGKINFMATKLDGEWVLNRLSIPRKPSADKAAPFIVFDFSEDDLTKLMSRAKGGVPQKPSLPDNPDVPEMSDDDLALMGKLSGTWGIDDEVYIVTTLSENGVFQEQVFKTKVKDVVLATAKGKWWVKEGYYFYQVTKVTPDVQINPSQYPFSFKIDKITETELTLVDSSGGEETKTRIK